VTTALTIKLADGTGRPALLMPSGSGWFYACPWCQAPVFSPGAWEEHERANADGCARRGEAYQPVPCPSSTAAAWEASSCPDPACLVNLPADRLAGELRRRQEAEALQQAREERDRRAQQYAATRGLRHQQDDALWARTQAAAGIGSLAGTPARRGDLVVVREHDPGYGTDVPSDRYIVGLVTSVTHAGAVKAYRPAGHLPEPGGQGRISKGIDLATRRPERTWVLSSSAVDVPGALATAACRTWPRSEDMARPFESMEDLTVQLQAHLKSSPRATWETLSAAARQWEQARCQARELRPAMAARGEEFTRASEQYAAAVAAANAAYRRAVADATATARD
jgi:hypothetical protein